MVQGRIFEEAELTAGGQDFVMNGQCTRKKIVWIGENAFLDVYQVADFGGVMRYENVSQSISGHVLSVKADIGSKEKIQADVWADSLAQAHTACHVLYRLLSASGTSMVDIKSNKVNKTFDRDLCPFSGFALSQLIQQCPSLTNFV